MNIYLVETNFFPCETVDQIKIYFFLEMKHQKKMYP